MSEREKPDIEERVTRLESLVEELLSEKRGPRPLSPKTSPPRSADRRPAAPGGEERLRPTTVSTPGLISTELKDRLSLAGESERWLGRVGIGFVILALAFLLKLSFERGWITPGLRLGVGFGVGIALLVLGLRLDPGRRRLEQALLGGSVAVFYLTGFAGFQLYQLLPFWIALSIMTATTVLSIALSQRQDSPLLSMIGVAGGLATPFLLDTGSGNVNALAVYASVVLLGGGAVQFHRGWIPLLGTIVLGGSIILSVVAFAAGGEAGLVPAMAIGVFWIVSAASPLFRPVVRPETLGGRKDVELWSSRISVAWGTGAAVLFLSVLLDLEQQGAGWLFVLFGLVTGAAAYAMRKIALSHWPAAEVSALCVALGISLVASDSTALLLILIEAAILFVIISRGAPRTLTTLGHLFAVVVSVGFLYYAGNAPVGGFLGLRDGALVRLGMLGVLVFISTRAGKGLDARYRGAAYLGLLVWFLSELAPLSFGAQLVTLAWSIQGATALVVSIRTRSQPLQLTGLATLALVAAKLLLFDLSQLDPGWRILMFFGFGIGLLGLAYLVNRPQMGEGQGEEGAPKTSP